MILVEPTPLGVPNLKVLLLCFENMSGLKINFTKSEDVVTGVIEEEKLRVANDFNCRLGSLPMSYLGLPISDKSLSVVDWYFSQRR
jgi:hypothetical protein